MPRIKYKTQDGKTVPGTTTIISQNLGWNSRPLMVWAHRQGLEGKDMYEETDKACEIGTIAHEMIEMELKGKSFDYFKYPSESIEKAKVAFGAWQEWKSLVNFELIGSEMSMVSEKYRFGGTIDIAAVKNKRAILDLKTSNAIYPENKLQVAAYGHLYEECTGEKIEAYYILQLGKNDGSFAYHYYPNLDTAFEAFLLLRRLHDLKKELN